LKKEFAKFQLCALFLTNLLQKFFFFNKLNNVCFVWVKGETAVEVFNNFESHDYCPC